MDSLPQPAGSGALLVPLSEVDVSAELDSRPHRPWNYEAEGRALGTLAFELAANPRNLLQKLVETALYLCRADSAGVSLLEEHDGAELFRWEALAGTYAFARNGTMPRSESPCGVCIDRNATQLMHLAGRCFPALPNDPPFVEALLVPFHLQGRPIGTVWVVMHQNQRQFDREDERLLRILADFASAGWQLWRSNARLAETNSALQANIEARDAAERELRAFSARLQEAREDERRRLSRAIHDHLGQNLAIINFHLTTLLREAPGDDAAETDRKKSISRLFEETIQELRKIGEDLRPGILDQLGLVAAIQWVANDFQLRHAIRCFTRLAELDVAIDHARDTALFRIVQEILSNVARHASASAVHIRLHEAHSHLILEVRDNGKGISNTERSSGKSLGILGMRERALLLGGELTIGPAPRGGTLVRVAIPH